MNPAVLVAAARARQGIERWQLALRAGVGETLVADVEEGRTVPDDELLATLLFVAGEELVIADGARSARPLRPDVDPLWMADERAKTPAKRLADAFTWNRFADELTRAGERARRGSS